MIEVGDYVRINNDFRLIALGIGKVVGINKDSIHVKMNFELPFSFKKENIANHSKQLIDLIEIGDYVNGSKVLAVMENMETGELHLEMTVNYTNEEIGDCTIYDKDIQTILTKESYMANCYKIGGENE